MFFSFVRADSCSQICHVKPVPFPIVVTVAIFIWPNWFTLKSINQIYSLMSAHHGRNQFSIIGHLLTLLRFRFYFALLPWPILTDLCCFPYSDGCTLNRMAIVWMVLRAVGPGPRGPHKQTSMAYLDARRSEAEEALATRKVRRPIKSRLQIVYNVRFSLWVIIFIATRWMIPCNYRLFGYRAVFNREPVLFRLFYSYVQENRKIQTCFLCVRERERTRPPLCSITCAHLNWFLVFC